MNRKLCEIIGVIGAVRAQEQRVVKIETTKPTPRAKKELMWYRVYKWYKTGK